MSLLLSILALTTLAAAPSERADSIRISLFSLFKPEALQARIYLGESARLDTGSLRAPLVIAPGEMIRIRLLGRELNIIVSDSFGRVKQSLTAREARISPAGATTFELSLPGKIKRVVRGELSCSAGDRSLKILLATDRESAVASVVAAEISGQRAPEVAKALAVVVRTFMLSHLGRHSDEGFDFCDTTHCQLYRGEQDLSIEFASPVVASAVAATAGERLSFAGRPIESYYTAVCGGLSATPEMIWGGAGQAGYSYSRVACRWCRASRYHRWQRAADARSLLEALSGWTHVHLSQGTELRAETAEPGDPVRSVIIRDAGRQITLGADEFRRAIGRRLGWSTVLSPTFNIERRGHQFIFRGRGFGSQVGLCVAGAVAQARAGRGYRDILSFYYPQSEIRHE